MEESNNTLFNYIWLQYNSMRSKYKPQVIRTNKKILTQDEFASLLRKATSHKLSGRDYGFLVGISRKYHYSVEHDIPLTMSDKQFSYLNKIAV